LEDFGEEVIFRSESEEESVVSDDVNEVLEAESETAGVIFVLSFDDDFDEEDFQDNSDKFFKSSELIFFGFELEVSGNDISDFALIKLEDTLENGFDLIDFKDQVLVGIVHQEDFSQLIKDKSDEVIQGAESLEGQKPLVPFVEFSVFGEDDVLAAEVILEEEEVNLVGDPSGLVEVDFAPQEVDNALRGLDVNWFESVAQSHLELLFVHFSLVPS
jgi:hypothetical protein